MERCELYSLSIPNVPTVPSKGHRTQGPWSTPSPDVLMHIQASTHEGVVPILHHYFGEVYQNSFCTHHKSEVEKQNPELAFVILPYHSHPNLSDLLGTRIFATNPVLAISFRGTFPSSVLVNPNDGTVKLQFFSTAVEEHDTIDLRTIGNIFATIYHSCTGNVYGAFKESILLTQKLQLFTQCDTLDIWYSLDSLELGIRRMNPIHETITRVEHPVFEDDDSDIWSVSESSSPTAYSMHRDYR
ncbi:hypothetical protein BDQ17DRAFT_1542869 [Cyathus striatus]|nr:hypothetical protein BDQ17DRAFT_1542869 [Cyathus striatus]